MKKVPSLFLGIALLSLSLTLVQSCSKKNQVDNCTDLINQVNAAEITYGTNPTIANCQAYKTALNNLLSCPVITAQERTAYQQLFSQLSCN